MYALAHAKINWTLETKGIRSDNYHLLDMLMQSVDICDRLDAELSDKITLEVDGELFALTENNLVYKAAVLLQSAAGVKCGARLKLQKRIPVGAGMGGGSADAAAALLLLMKLWDVNMTSSALEALALSLGADVPFCLRGGLCRVSGIGERVEQYDFQPNCPLVVVQPCLPLSTKEVFSLCGAQGDTENTARAAEALRKRDYNALSALMTNDLEAVSQKLRPEIAEVKNKLEEDGAIKAMMTGSGSAVYGLFLSKEKAEECAARLTARYTVCFYTETIGEGVTL